MYTNVTKPPAQSYTNVSKPTVSNGQITSRQGRSIGLLIPLTISLPPMITQATYTKISKPPVQSYTNINKP